MKTIRFLSRPGWTLLLATLACPVWAGPLQRAHVAADAKWVLHLDLDNLRSTQVGDCLVKGRIDPKMEKARADLKTYLDFDFDWTQINSVTAYGMDFEGGQKPVGILLVQTTMDLQKALESAIAKQAQAGVEGNVKLVQEHPVPVYDLRGDVFVALPAGQPMVLAKTTGLLDKAVAVVTGRAASLTGTQTFLEFPATPQSFAFLAMAAGFADNAPVPPQAKMLKMTDAGRIVLGESGTQVFLTVTLRAKSPEVGAQLQQVVQGLLALGALGQSNNQDLMQLIRSTKVTVNDRMVTLGLELPVLTVVQKMQERQKNDSGR